MLKSLTLAGVLMLSSLSFAHAAGPADMAKKPMASHHNGPCAAMFKACKDAGYTRGDMKNGKGLMANCIKPLDEGKTVPGVTLNNADIQACKIHHAAKKAEFEQRMKDDPAFAKKVQERKAKWETRKEEMKAKGIVPGTKPTPATN